MRINTPINELLSVLFSENAIIHVVLSSPLSDELPQKITIRPIEIKQKLQYQVSSFKDDQVFHQNLDPNKCQQLLTNYLTTDYKQGLICTTKADYQVLTNKKQQSTILKKPPTKSSPLPLAHNRPKNYILEEGASIPFLIELGIMSQNGHVIAKKSDKFRQLNRFLEMISDVLPNLDRKHRIRIIDFGCGKAYLTFALYHYLVNIEGLKIDVQGLDLKEEVIKQCQDLADRLGYGDLKFSVGDINNYTPQHNVDMVITLHACDTATDAALEKAIRWNATVILCVPCCQHELFKQVHNDTLAPILDHGILKERFAALVTDAARAQLLDILGYQTQVLEFIDLEHTPKNLLIRAIKKKDAKKSKEAKEKYVAFKNALGINPSLEYRFKDEL